MQTKALPANPEAIKQKRHPVDVFSKCYIKLLVGLREPPDELVGGIV
jgi:hypothetical protein